VVTASEAVRNGYPAAQSQSQQNDPQVQPPYSAAPQYSLPTTYSDSLPASTIPSTTTAISQQQQQRSYNIQPPPSSITSTTQPQQSQRYDENIGYQITVTRPSPTSNITPAAVANNHPNNTNMPFLPDTPDYTHPPPPPPQQHSTYPVETGASMYHNPNAMTYPTSNNPDNFSNDNLYSIPPGIWPTSIVQYQNGGI
jgi:hypothetical protein